MLVFHESGVPERRVLLPREKPLFCSISGVPAPVLCGALTALAALVPVVGTGIIWVPLAGLIAINGPYLKAGLLAL